MPRSFDLSADYMDNVEEVHRAFRTEEYWRARLADIPVDEAKLELLRVGGESGTDGTIDVITLQVVHGHHLAALVKQLHRGDLCIRREEKWGPVTDGAATASIVGAIVNTPVQVKEYRHDRAVLSGGLGGNELVVQAGIHKLDPALTVRVREGQR